MSDLALGVRLYLRAAGMVLRSPRLLRLGALPAVVTALLYAVALVVLVRYLGDLVGVLTGFADAWSPTAREATEVVVGIAVLAAVALVAVLTFVAVTLAIGGPFYEKLSEIVDDTVGGVPAGPERSWAVALARGARDGLLLVGMSVLVAIPLFAAGFLPVVGQTVVPVVAALVGGRLLVLELTAPALERRGVGFGSRRRVVRSRRVLGWAVGVPTYLLCLIPLVGIVAVPIGAAAATLVAREMLGEPTGVPARPAPPPVERRAPSVD
ncbi:EI24 domain-containing protein [Actinomycetospora termitidis]|uniref:EI24 domain-containing protein n=1 Tax=Actinomycetospora termitidis TaxID=3053470 RepID=A0ABT7M3G1_9PSEU|nr:EI24 domain-containing protein [Actinomycetospora sp. Odt1-22]MDL5154961.1 EI24 domain-containing protein [Actinomycetospora sp. Odt1-22]